MAFPFQKKLDELEEFYDYTLKLYSHGASMPLPPNVSSATASAITTQANSYKAIGSEYLRRAVLALMCGLWETLIDDIQLNDNPRYTANIVAPYYKWFDTNVNEIAQTRHCILHNDGIIDASYLSKSSNPYGYVIGDNIQLDIRIGKFFIDMRTSFRNLMV